MHGGLYACFSIDALALAQTVHARNSLDRALALLVVA